MLESGDYEQSVNTMCSIKSNGDHCFCVQGIAVEALAQENPEKFGWSTYSWRTEKGKRTPHLLMSCGDIYCLQPEHKEALGFEYDPAPGELVKSKEDKFWEQLLKLNDMPKESFEEMAKRIRRFYAAELKGWTA